jgi:hypothetical protein
MRRRDFFRLIGVAMAPISAPMPSAAQSLARADRPEIKAGDASIFHDRNIRTGEQSEIRFQAITVDADKIVTETSGRTSGTRTFTRDWNLLEVRTGNIVSQTAKPFWPYLRFPLEVGQTWASPIDVEVTTQTFRRSSKWQWKAQVAVAEPITVPAGTFQAFRIEYEGKFTSRQGGRSWTGTHKETAWYAPAVMRIVRREFEQVVPANKFRDHHVIELLSFTPAQ